MKTFESEQFDYTDRLTGVTVRQLTHWRGNSNHIYFTNASWWDSGRRMIFCSDRDNRANLFSIEWASGTITQITDADDGSYQTASVNPVRNEAYFWRDRALYAVDLERGTERALFAAPEGFVGAGTNSTADGAFICCWIREAVDLGFTVNTGCGYVGFEEIYAAHPLCRIFLIPVDGGDAVALHEDRTWIGHVNTSPTQANLLTFCHEGPWEKVAQRMWVLDRSSGQVAALRPQTPEEAMGHEYWLRDGLSIGYHGRTPDGPVFGFIRHDGAEHIEAPFRDSSTHFQSNTRELIVGDGSGNETPVVMLWEFNGERFAEPRVVCVHRSSRNVQRAHVHPCFSPDGRSVVYTSDTDGYCNVYRVEVPPLNHLPTLSEIRAAANGRGLGNLVLQARTRS